MTSGSRQRTKMVGQQGFLVIIPIIFHASIYVITNKCSFFSAWKTHFSLVERKRWNINKTLSCIFSAQMLIIVSGADRAAAFNLCSAFASIFITILLRTQLCSIAIKYLYKFLALQFTYVTAIFFLGDHPLILALQPSFLLSLSSEYFTASVILVVTFIRTLVKLRHSWPLQNGVRCARAGRSVRCARTPV